MGAPSAFDPRESRRHRADVGYLVAFLLVLALPVGVGYQLYSATRVSVGEIEWPDPLGMGTTKTERRLRAAVGDTPGPLAVLTATALPAAAAARPAAQAPAG